MYVKKIIIIKTMKVEQRLIVDIDRKKVDGQLSRRGDGQLMRRVDGQLRKRKIIDIIHIYDNIN